MICQLAEEPPGLKPGPAGCFCGGGASRQNGPISEFGSAKRYVLFPDRQIVCLSFLIDLQIIVFYEETYDTR